METKKRHVSDDSEVSLPKKRALTNAQGSPTPHVNVNGLNSDEPKDDNLEHFRKEAIYRRMQEYSRECERGRSRIAELERWQRNCEAGIAALETCWTQLVDTTKSLMGPDDVPKTTLRTNDLFDLTTHVSDPESPLADALRSKLDATKEMLTTVVQRGSPTLLKEQFYMKAQAAQAECTTLRSEMALLRTRLKRLEEEKDRYRHDLLAAEKRADRASSRTVAQMNGNADASTSQLLPVPEEVAVKSESGVIPHAPPLTPSTSEQVEGQAASDWQRIAESRAAKIEELDTRLKQTYLEIKQLSAENSVPVDAKVEASPIYQLLRERSTHLEVEVGERQSRVEGLEAELKDLREGRIHFEDAIQAETSRLAQDLKSAIEKKDKDLVRLREQRDQQSAELNERKQREAFKQSSFDEMKTLAETRSERIAVLQSELTRFKTQIAADAGHESLLSFLLRDKNGDATYVDDLQQRLTEARTAALEDTISTLADTSPDVAVLRKAEADLRQQLGDTSKQLDQCRSILGDISNLPPDAAHLANQLKVKEEELRQLRLEVEQHSQAEAASYAELDRLSAAWEILDKQVKSKVFDLKAAEERVVKAGQDRAKLENKYFAAMREKDAVENERKNLARNLEKQAKALEKSMLSEKALQAHLADHDKQVAVYEQVQASYNAKVASVQEEVSKWRFRAEDMKRRYAELVKQPCKGCEDLSAQTTKALQMQDEAIKMREKAEKLLAKAKATPSIPKSSKEAQLQSEVDKCMAILKCSTCKMRMRSTVITKCMHSFCKDCVDARIATRQRKCPACNLAFGQADVQQVFFQ